ncbi:hypothetical protein K2V61_03030 [Staphylococcus simulans]|nr:hypothetical protein [Staphylococcus simulans]MCD8914538.1 hypothetical protein [Staphylococcus simulans]
MDIKFKLDGTRSPEEYRKIWAYLGNEIEKEHEMKKKEQEKEKSNKEPNQ